MCRKKRNIIWLVPVVASVVVPSLATTAGCSSSDDSLPSDAVAADADGAVADTGSTEPAPDTAVSPWLGCNNSGGERLEDGCYFEWRCPYGQDRRVTCAPDGDEFLCSCSDSTGAEQGSFRDPESCTRNAIEIARLANAGCGWSLPEDG